MYSRVPQIDIYHKMRNCNNMIKIDHLESAVKRIDDMSIDLLKMNI